MKKVLPLLLFIAVISSTAVAQIRKIPASVTDAFKQKYPSATNVEWKDKLTNFTAEFNMDGTKYEARYNSKGEWQSTENEIKEGDLPAAVKDGYDKSKYADWKMEELYKIVLPKDVTQYRIRAGKTDFQKKNLLFNSTGRLLKDNLTL